MKGSHKRSQYLIVAVTVVLMLGVGFIYLMNQSFQHKKPLIVFKDNLVFQQGQQSFETEGELPILPVIKVNDLINESQSRYDEVSFNKVACGNQPHDLMFRSVNTQEVGQGFKGRVFASYNDVCGTFTFTFDVVVPD